MMRSSRLGLLTIGLATSSAAVARVAAAQQTITPAMVAARGLPIRADTVDGFAGGKDARNWFGFYVYAVSRTTIGGKSVYLVTTDYTSKEKGTFQSDTLALDAATLDPIWRRFHARTDSASVTFAGRHASGWSLQNDKRVVIDHQLSQNCFAGPLLRWIGGALPLASGFKGELTVFSMWTNAESAAPFEVIGGETVDVGGKKFDTWLLQSPSGSRTWIDRSSHRVVQVFTPEAGRAGTWYLLR
jgi:hypothetical protein